MEEYGLRKLRFKRTSSFVEKYVNTRSSTYFFRCFMWMIYYFPFLDCLCTCVVNTINYKNTY